MLLQCGGAKVLELISCRFRQQRLAQAAAGRKPGPFLQLHGVSVRRGQKVWRLEGCNFAKSSSRGSRRPSRPSVARCFGVVTPAFFRRFRTGSSLFLAVGGERCYNLELVSNVLGRTRRKPKASSSLHWHAVSVWQHQLFKAVGRHNFGLVSSHFRLVGGRTPQFGASF